MKTKQLEWKRQKGKFQNGMNCFCGNIKIGWLSWNGTSSNPRYRARFILLDSMEELGGETPEECMSNVKVAFDKFINQIIETG